MKNLPNSIYLNIDIGNENPKDIDFNELSGISWCEDRVNTDDLVYYSRDFIISLLSARIKETEEKIKTSQRMKQLNKALDFKRNADIDITKNKSVLKELKSIITQL